MKVVVRILMVLSCLLAASAGAQSPAAQTVPVAISVVHSAPERWLVRYQFAQPVTMVRLEAVGPFRQQAWTIQSPEWTMSHQEGQDVIATRGAPQRELLVSLAMYDRWEPKDYASFLRFSDGGRALYLPHLSGEAGVPGALGVMQASFTVQGLARENVTAPAAGSMPSYAYFGPLTLPPPGKARLLIDPATPAWLRETLVQVGERLEQTYGALYQRPAGDVLWIIFAVAGFEQRGFSLKGGYVAGQIAYLASGDALLGDSPGKRARTTMLIAHEMAHVWQMQVERGGAGEEDPWVFEGGAEAMALEALQAAGLLTAEEAQRYVRQQAEVCEKHHGATDTYEGIYACGLTRFQRLGLAPSLVWRALIRETERSGRPYSARLLEEVLSTMPEAAGQGASRP